MISQDQTKRHSNIDAVLILSGIVAPVFHLVGIIISSSLTPGYSHISQAISVLGSRGAPFNEILNYLGVIPAGILTILFSFAIFRKLKGGKSLFICGCLVTIAGIGRLCVGVFPCDPGCLPIISITGRLHALTGFTSMFAGSIAPLFMAIGLRRRNFKALFYLSIVLGLASLFLFMLFFSQFFFPFFGAIQRLLLTLTYVWTIAVAVKMKYSGK